jgi:hypothetical protein
LDLGARVDFTNAQRGEVTIVAPVSQTLRLESRVKRIPIAKSDAEHPIVRARTWQQWLDRGEVASRFALAQRVGIDPAMVTRVLKLVGLAPNIQDYLASLKSPSALWHFNIKVLGNLAELPKAKQYEIFAKICARFNARNPQLQRNVTTLQWAPSTKPIWRNVPRLAAG